MTAYGSTIKKDTQDRWVVECAPCGTQAWLSHLADITTISAVLEPPAEDFSVLEFGDDTWQRITIRRKDGTTITIHECKEALT